jgi:hypothetical protein
LGFERSETRVLEEMILDSGIKTIGLWKNGYRDWREAISGLERRSIGYGDKFSAATPFVIYVCRPYNMNITA